MAIVISRPRAADNAMIRMVTYHPLVLLQHRVLVMILMLICLLLGVHLLSAEPRLHLRPGLLYARTAIVISHPHAADNAMIQMLTYHPLVLLHRKAAAMIQMLTYHLLVVLQHRAVVMILMLISRRRVTNPRRGKGMTQMLTYRLLGKEEERGMIRMLTCLHLGVALARTEAKWMRMARRG
jgi:hypothetical protein